MDFGSWSGNLLTGGAKDVTVRMTMMKEKREVAMSEMRCAGCGVVMGWDDVEFHLDCIRPYGFSLLAQQIAELQQRLGELVQKTEDVLQDIVTYDLPRGAQYRVRAAVLAKMLEEIRDEVMALQAL
jgi:hypothetical protein